MNGDTEIETKLARARTRLILDKPFLGALVLRLPMKAADPKWCQTTATDARSFYYNPDYIAALSHDQTQFILAHEALHCALSHFARRQHRQKHRWDVACDHAINPLLVREGMKPPPGTLLIDSYEGMTAEEIYPYIDENSSDKPMDKHVYDEDDQEQRSKGQGQDPDPEPDPDQNSDAGEQPGDDQDGSGGDDAEQQQDNDAGGAPQPPPLDSSEQDALDVQWKQLAGL